MADVYVVVEGYGEHGFLRECVAPHLGAHGVYLHPALVGKPGLAATATATANRDLHPSHFRLGDKYAEGDFGADRDPDAGKV